MLINILENCRLAVAPNLPLLSFEKGTEVEVEQEVANELIKFKFASEKKVNINIETKMFKKDLENKSIEDVKEKKQKKSDKGE